MWLYKDLILLVVKHCKTEAYAIYSNFYLIRSDLDWYQEGIVKSSHFELHY